MDETKTATETNAQTIVPEEVVTTPTTIDDDVEAKLATLEDAKNKALEEAANYKVAYLKEKSKKAENLDLDETEDERIERILNEKLAKTKLAQIDLEKETLLKKLAKENKELKLAQMNKTTTPPAGFGTHTEAPAVVSTSITPEQLVAFKARGWSDKDIENYKANLRKYSGR